MHFSATAYFTAHARLHLTRRFTANAIFLDELCHDPQLWPKTRRNNAFVYCCRRQNYLSLCTFMVPIGETWPRHMALNTNNRSRHWISTLAQIPAATVRAPTGTIQPYGTIPPAHSIEFAYRNESKSKTLTGRLDDTVSHLSFSRNAILLGQVYKGCPCSLYIVDH